MMWGYIFFDAMIMIKHLRSHPSNFYAPRIAETRIGLTSYGSFLI